MKAKTQKNSKEKTKTKAKKAIIAKKVGKIKAKTTKTAKAVKKIKKPTIAKKAPIKKAVKKPAKKTAKKVVKKKITKKPAAKKPLKALKKTKPTKKIAKKTNKKPAKEIKVVKKTKPAKISKKNEKPIKKDLKPSKEKKLEENNIKKSDKKETSSRDDFKAGEFAVYPSHGVGKIIGMEDTKIMGQDFSCYLMSFERDKLVIKIPVATSKKVGLRHLSTKDEIEEVLSVLRSGVKKLKGMWSRRAQEYETKINSGDIMLLAEVLRDLTRDIEDGDRSYSERIIYETAINRLASEYEAVYMVSFEEAKEKVIITAKDKLMSEVKSTQKDDFDDFDADHEEVDEDDEIDDDDLDDDDLDDDFDDDFDDDEKPKKKRK